ncbi:MAG TPA: hypothetical protein VFQ47_05005 [Nitrososphaera sp.]|jgi:hypothetical protein|nr:hypothetical protein [Nitrososphaera sp.]
MTNNDTMPAEPKTLTEYEFTKSSNTVKNLETLRAIAYMVINRNHPWFDKLNRQHWELKSELWTLKELLESVAVIMSKTYSERGDAYQLTDDRALMQIRDLLLQYNPKIVSSSKERKALRVKERMRRWRQKQSIPRYRRWKDSN